MSAKHKPGRDFDPAALMERIDTARGSKSYRQVALAAGISPSTFSAMSQGRLPDVVTLGRLLEWLDGKVPFWMHQTP